MDFLDAIRQHIPGGAGLEALPAGRWDPVSFTPDRAHGGQKIGKVTAHGVGLKDGVGWSYWTFVRNDDQTTHTVWCTQDVTKKENVFVVDGDHNADKGAPKPNGRFAIKPLIQGFSVKTAFECLYDEGGKTAAYRFDGKNFP